MRVTLYLSNETLGLLQDQARLAHRPPKSHLEWLIEQTLREREPTAGQEDLQRRVERLEAQLRQTATTDAGV